MIYECCYIMIFTVCVWVVSHRPVSSHRWVYLSSIHLLSTAMRSWLRSTTFDSVCLCHWPVMLPALLSHLSLQSSPALSPYTGILLPVYLHCHPAQVSFYLSTCIVTLHRYLSACLPVLSNSQVPPWWSDGLICSVIVCLLISVFISVATICINNIFQGIHFVEYPGMIP